MEKHPTRYIPKGRQVETQEVTTRLLRNRCKANEESVRDKLKSFQEIPKKRKKRFEEVAIRKETKKSKQPEGRPPLEKKCGKSTQAEG